MLLFRRIKKHLPTHKEVEKSRYIGLFGESLKQKDLWALNRSSSAKGVAIGIFCAFLPMPFEMLAAIFISIMLRGNLPLAFTGIWISNPLTWVPLYTPCYLLGSWLMGINPIPIEKISILSLGWHYVALWLGCLIIGSILSYSSYSLINFLWRSEVRQRWNKRRSERRRRNQSTKRPSSKL